jgi:predicted molibdopterin-dependent oxidoreductase YjgC
MGLAPGFRPGRVKTNGDKGLDAGGILAAAAAGDIQTLVLLGVDALSDFPDRQLVSRALANVGCLITVGAFASDASERADVFLPVSVWGEKTGTTTNLEGRVMRLARLVTPEGTTLEDWRIAAELALRFGTDFGLDTVEDVQDDIARRAPAYVGVDANLLRRARDGAVVPIAHHPHEIVFHAVLGVSAGVSWEPIRPGVAAEETHLSSIGTGVVGATGTGSLTTIKPGLGAEETAAADGADATVAAAADALASTPALHRWEGDAPAPVPIPPDAYSLRLVAARTLYDAGRTVGEGPSLSSLAPGTALVVHPSDLSRVGVAAEGDTVRVTSARATVELPVRTDTAIAPGTCFIPFAQAGDAPNNLIDVSQPVTELRVETTR